MDKQELIEKLRQESFAAVRISNTGSNGYKGLKLGETIDLINQLDEPQKVKVPAFVAEWIETAKKEKRTLHYSMQDIDDACYYHKGDDPLYQWMFVCGDSSEHQETFARAYMDGYEVEEEPKWIVRVKEMFFMNWGEDGTCPTFVIDDNPGAKRLAKPFIKSEAQSLAESLHGSIEKV